MSEIKFFLSVIFDLHPSLPDEFKPDELINSILQFLAAYRLLSPLNHTRLYVSIPGKAAYLIYPLSETSD